MAATKVTTKVIADDAVTIDKINDSALVTESEGISSNDNDTTIPTSAAVKDYVDTEVAGLVDSAPATLDTLNELAAALGDDASFSTTVTNSIATKQDASTALTTTTNFSGDVSGTYNAIVIADDSHNHTIANVDGLQTSLDGKVDGTGTAGTLPKLSDSNTITDSAISESGEIIDLDTTGAIKVPDGTTAQRPGTPVAGMFRYNTTDGQFEGYTTEWGAIAGSGGAGGGSVDVVTTQHTGDGTTKGFALDSTPGDNDAVQVYLNGVYQVKDAANYSISGSTLTFVTAPTNSTAIEFVHFVLTSGGGGGISWDTDVKTANFGATAGEGYFVNTTSAAITVTLPSSPSAGDEVSIVDYAGTADTNNITITSSDNINGASDDVVINYERGGVSMVYVDATQGWIAYNAVNESNSSFSGPALPLSLEYLIVAGGGAGGNNFANSPYDGYGNPAGGGGAGGLLTSTLSSPTVGNTLTVTVGGGGAGTTTASQGANGTNSSVTGTGVSLTCIGGGAGGQEQVQSGTDGGSGGGASANGTSGSGTTGQGNDGGASPSGYPGGGGGGAGAAGGNSTSTVAGDGGIGIQSNITGTQAYYAGGGGGGAASYQGKTAGAGGAGGGGAGNSSGAGANGTDFTGGGGGGAGTNLSSNEQGGNGGSGVVIFKVPTNHYTGATTGNPTITTDGDYTIIKFESSGSYTI